MSPFAAAIVALASGLLVGLVLRAFVAAATAADRLATLSLAALSGTLLLMFAVAASLLALPPNTWLWLAAGGLAGAALGDLAFRLGLSGRVRAEIMGSRLIPPWPIIAGAIVVAILAGLSPSLAVGPPPPEPSPSQTVSPLPTPSPSPRLSPTPSASPSPSPSPSRSPTPKSSTSPIPSPPQVRSVTPSCGLSAGGREVVVGGSNLEGATAVTFNGVAGSIKSVGPTSILVITPTWRGQAGRVDVTVRTAAGTSPTTPEDLYSFTTVTVASLKPSQGVLGTLVEIVGAGFDPNYTLNTVRFGNARAVARRGTTSDLYVTAPQGSGTVDVTVTTTAGGTSCATADSKWTYLR